MDDSPQSDARLVAELDDLIMLDHDAIQAYGLAITSLRRDDYKRAIESFRADHERHIAELRALVRARHGRPIELPHLPSGAFKLALQAAGALGGDRTVLLAFRANERQVRDRYRRSARAVHPEEVTSVLARAADDEGRHYLWAIETLDDDFGVTPDSALGRAERVVERAHARMADGMEDAERRLIGAARQGGSTLVDRVKRNPVGSALLALGTGFLVSSLFGDRR